jgi:Retinoic acid induced 16-like protein
LLQQIWRNASNLSQDEDAIENVRRTIQELTSILSDENTRPSPHPCISFASSKQIYVTVGKIATASYDESIVEEAVTLFKKLIECDEEDFLEDEAFSKSLTSFLSRITGANSISLSQETQVKVVELAFNIAAKIKLQPEILPAWFTTQKKDADQEYKDDHEKFAGRTHKEDFPLFYLLIDNIHEDGPTGEFARTGLLYIIESAITSVALEEWLVESDLATLMATGLGALYGRLSRKLVIDYVPDQLPPILALSDYQHPVTTADVVSSTDIEFHAHMDTFLSHLLFWQDVLQHCQSVEVTQTLLEHFRVCFLQQIL